MTETSLIYIGARYHYPNSDISVVESIQYVLVLYFLQYITKGYKEKQTLPIKFVATIVR